MTQKWNPTFSYTAKLTCDVTLVRVWKPSNMQTGLHMTFEVFPNLTGDSHDSVADLVWRHSVEAFVIKKAAELTGLTKKDFYVLNWTIGPAVVVATPKAPKKQVEV